jgi:ABC-type nitrate/sulfonate/bicarbonate transport system substrate-binding protein
VAATPITVVAFGGGFNLPLWAAEREGLFERHGVAVTLAITADSRQVFSGLMDGRYQVAVTALDNIVAHQSGHADPVADGPTDFFAFMGSDSGFLSLVGAPDVPDVRSLAGRTVSVDDPANGFSIVLREMLARHGLAAADVHWERAGGTDRRYAALIEGRHAATMLRSPFDLLARQHGCRRLMGTRELVGAYLGIVGATRRSWAEGDAANGRALVGFVRAWRDAVRWLKAPARRAEAEALLCERVPGMTPELARLSCQAMLDPEHGFLGDAGLDAAAVQAVVALRRKHTTAPMPDDPSAFIDERYWRQA